MPRARAISPIAATIISGPPTYSKKMGLDWNLLLNGNQAMALVVIVMQKWFVKGLVETEK